MGMIDNALGLLGAATDSALTRLLEREPRPPVAVTRRRLAGLDIGQRDDWTALAVVDEAEEGALRLTALERIRHKPYPEVARLVRDTMAALAAQQPRQPAFAPPIGPPTLLVDVTGVGRPVTDQLDELEVPHERISIHGGSAVGKLDDGTLSVPKRDLIAALVIAFESKTLTIARGLKHAGALEQEAQAFQMKLSASGHDTYNAREGEHDDLLLAVALPVWYVGRVGRVGVYFL